MAITRRQAIHIAAATPFLPAAGAAVKSTQVGANTAIAGLGLLESIALLRQLNFPVIEIQGMGVIGATPGKFPGFDFDKLTPAERQTIRAELQGTRRTIHLPYAGLHYFDAEPSRASASLERVNAAFQAAAYFRCEVAVVHTTIPEGFALNEAWPHMLQRFRAWGSLAAQSKTLLAIETGTGAIASVAGYLKLIREINHPWVGATLDVGHQIAFDDFTSRVPAAQRSTPEGIRAYNDVLHRLIDGLGGKLFHLHVHDIDARRPAAWKDHVPLGTGVIDYPRLLAKLNRVQYRGLLILEIAAPDMRAALADSKLRLENAIRGASS